MSSEKHTRPYVGVASVIMRGGKVLMGLRTGKHCGGMYGFPGGHLELYESFEACAAREAEEEAGLIIAEPEIEEWTVENVLFPNEDKHYVTIFTVTLWHPNMGEPVNKEPHKLKAWEWFYWNEMPRPIMPGIMQLHEKGKYPKELAYVRK